MPIRKPRIGTLPAVLGLCAVAAVIECAAILHYLVVPISVDAAARSHASEDRIAAMTATRMSETASKIAEDTAAAASAVDAEKAGPDGLPQAARKVFATFLDGDLPISGMSVYDADGRLVVSSGADESGIGDLAKPAFARTLKSVLRTDRPATASVILDSRSDAGPPRKDQIQAILIAASPLTATAGHDWVVTISDIASFADAEADCPLPNCRIEYQRPELALAYDPASKAWRRIPPEEKAAASTSLLPNPTGGAIVVHDETDQMQPWQEAAVAIAAIAFVIAFQSLAISALFRKRVIEPEREAMALLTAGAETDLLEAARSARSEIDRLRTASAGGSARFQTLVDANSAPMLVVDSATATIVHANRAAETYLGIKGASARFLDDIVDMSADTREKLLDAEGGQQRVRIRTAAGGSVPADLHFGPASIDGRVWTLAVVIDASTTVIAETRAMTAQGRLTEAIERRAELLQIQRDQERKTVANLMEFHATLSHELKNPLAAIAFTAQNLAAGDDPKTIGKAERISANATRMSRIIDRFLIDAKFDATGRQDLSIVASDALEMASGVARGKAETDRLHHYSVKMETPGPDVLIDRQFFEHVIDNVLSNAAKYSPQDSSIEVVGRAIEKGVEISVLDHGIGIPDAEKNRVFERFYRASTAKKTGISGNGIGMHFCKKVVEMFDGTISIHDTPGGGTTVRIILPTATAPAAQEAPAA